MTPSSTTKVLKCDPSSISFSTGSDIPEISSPETLDALKTASHLLHLLKPVAFPTETVYGLGAVALNTTAALRIFSTKGRPADNPLIVHVSSFTMLREILPPDYTPSRAYEALMKRLWPGALTLLFPRDSSIIPTVITAGQTAVAIRMPSHPVARALIAVANAPLAAPSANSSGKPSPTRAEHVLHDLSGKISIILDGGRWQHSRIAPRGITVEQIEQVLREELHDCSHAPTTPGMKYRHYSPSVPVTLLRTSPPPSGVTPILIESLAADLRVNNKPVNIGIMAPSNSRIWDQTLSADGVTWQHYHLGSSNEPSVTAHRLFNGFLTLEQKGVDVILIEEIAEEKEGLAVMNRVHKAASTSRWIALE
ncbi:DHBP synthase RibB-like alpha/beta domain-containing protein [Infundibulicybe gibba]|nr:DHBP synthase RibB-like alpha/beta domain-containing protein [Infundibulicybe gibba]